MSHMHKCHQNILANVIILKYLIYVGSTSKTSQYPKLLTLTNNGLSSQSLNSTVIMIFSNIIFCSHATTSLPDSSIVSDEGIFYFVLQIHFKRLNHYYSVISPMVNFCMHGMGPKIFSEFLKSQWY